MDARTTHLFNFHLAIGQAWKSLRHHRLVSFATILGVATGMCVVTAILIVDHNTARSYPGVLSLTQSLDAAGYPTAIQTHQDDGGIVWYRGLVGPYANREGADAAARQLRRERGLQVWVTEIGTGFPAEEAVN